MSDDLDDVDRGILHALQRDARDATAAEMSEAVGVSPSTVRNRIERLESEGVIRGYRPDVDYERAGFPLQVHVVCRAPPEDRHDVAGDVLALPGVVRVRELLTGADNLHVEAVVTDSAAADALLADVADLGVDVVSSSLATETRARPLDHFAGDDHDS